MKYYKPSYMQFIDNSLSPTRIAIVNNIKNFNSFSGVSKAILLSTSISITTALLLVAPIQPVYADEILVDEAHLFDAKSNLQEILTSEQYAKPIESEEWVSKPEEPKEAEKLEKNWFIEFLERLFDFEPDYEESDDEGFDFSIVNLMAALLKIVFIAALIIFIAWVIIRATGMKGWGSKLTSKARRLSAVSDYEATQLGQGWKTLPVHEDIPKVVDEMIDSQQYNQAASILYRGGLRWLAKSQTLYINPATTEMQCVQQMNAINHSETSLSTATKDYMTKVIHAWIEQAYNPNTDSVDKVAAQANTLKQLGDSWLLHLPIVSMTAQAQHNNLANSSSDATNLGQSSTPKHNQEER